MATDLTTDELTLHLDDDENLLIIDVRTPGEFETAHIPGSWNVPLDSLGEHRDELARIDRDVVLVCQSGNRAAQAEQGLAAAGMARMRVLKGGMNSWVNEARPTNSTSDRWGLERQVRLVAGSIVLVAILVSIFVPAVRYVAGAVGAGLAFAAITDTCAMGMILAKLPYNRVDNCDPDAIVAQLTGRAAG